MAIDPVCGMTVEEKTAEFKTEYLGKTYYFCSLGCKKAFGENPKRYLREGTKGMPEAKKPWWKFR